MSDATATGRRIGLLGGSFDPVHNAHVALARAALDQLALDELRWVPAARPWQKARELADAAHRAAMVRLAMGDEPRYRFEPCELRRDGPSYTVDTVRELQAAEPAAQWLLILGADQYQGLHTWHGWQALIDLVTLAVAGRPGAARAVNPQVAGAARCDIEMPAMPVSSTDIRARLAAGQGVAGLVPDAVARYIELHHLYQGPLRS